MFGVYDIIETVGQGGMGIVYRAHDTALDRIVALKVLKEDLRQNKQVAARFQREAEAIASLNHPNIIHIYSVGAVGRIPYIAMEFIEGAPLSTAMKRVKSFPWKRALHIAEQVADALACAHDAHIIHRDIKPGNILLGANDHAYVTDFGIAKVLTAETQLTVEGSRLGTPHYMSPERCSKADITSSSDLYSLGVVLFQLLSGRLPYEANAPVELIKKIVADPPARLSDYTQDVPEDVERLVAYLIEKKVANRPKHAKDVADMCRRVIEGEPLFEEGSAAAALRDLRDNTPTPTTAITTHMDSALDARGFLSRAQRAWKAVPPSGRLWAAGLLVIIAMGVVGQWTARRSFGDYALATVANWDRSANGWTSDASPASIISESAGVSLAPCNLPGFDISRLAPVGAGGFVAELTQQTGRAATILAVHPESGSVRVGIPASAYAAAPRLLAGVANADAGSGGAAEPYYFAVESAPGRIGVVVGDALLHDGATGTPIVGGNELERAAGGPVKEIRRAAIGPNATEIALSARGPSGGKDQLLRARFGNGALRVDPVLLDTAEVLAMAYGAYGDLVVAQRAENAIEVFSLAPGGSGSARKSLDSIGKADGEVVRLTAQGAVLRHAADGASQLTWRGFARGDARDLGEGNDAVVRESDGAAIVAAPDRRGNAQLWLVPRAGGGRQQLTFLADGIGDHLAVSNDGRFAATSARGRDLPTLVLVDIAAAGAA